MARNKITDVRDHLFAALERIDNDELTPEAMELEIKKAHAVKGVASVIVQSAKAETDFMKLTGKIVSATPFFEPISQSITTQDFGRIEAKSRIGADDYDKSEEVKEDPLEVVRYDFEVNGCADYVLSTKLDDDMLKVQDKLTTIIKHPVSITKIEKITASIEERLSHSYQSIGKKNWNLIEK